MSISRNRTAAAVVAALRGRRWNAEDAEKVLAAWRASGLPAQQFALEHGLDPQRLWWWQRRLREAPGEARRARLEPATHARLVPAVITVPPRGEWSVTIRTAEVVIDVDAERVSPEWIAILIERLGSV
jgi:hypothetical protein